MIGFLDFSYTYTHTQTHRHRQTDTDTNTQTQTHRHKHTDTHTTHNHTHTHTHTPNQINSYKNHTIHSLTKTLMIHHYTPSTLIHPDMQKNIEMLS